VVGAVGLVALALWAILPRWRAMAPAHVRGLVLALGDVPGVRHVLLVFGGYERWRALHRTTGLFVAAGFVHGLLDGSPFAASQALRWSYIATGGVGLAFYVYRELLARFFLSLHDYQIVAVRDVQPGLVEIGMRPLGRAMEFVPGQFAMVYVEAKDGWHRHPFTISSAPREDVLRVTVKALGDYTSQLQQLVEPGMPAVIGGPHGRFNHRRGTERQLWIAGGVGVAPFLSWIRALDGDLPQSVDFFYSADGAPPFAAEIEEIADRHVALRAHLVDTSVEGRLTPERVLAALEGDLSDLTVFLCGPLSMVRTFETELRRAGLPSRRIHREHFDWR
jgi:predicted ferric reductase